MSDQERVEILEAENLDLKNERDVLISALAKATYCLDQHQKNLAQNHVALRVRNHNDLKRILRP